VEQPTIGRWGYVGNSPDDLRDNRCAYSAWISPDGKLYAVESHNHDAFAENCLGVTNWGMLDDYWVHITSGNLYLPGRDITQAQKDTLFDIQIALDGLVGYPASYLCMQIKELWSRM